MWGLVFLWFVGATAHVDWAVKNGAYLHPSLEYRDGGMYATSDIEVNEILAILPFRLEMSCLKCANKSTSNCTCSLQSLVDLVDVYREGFWAPYVQSLDFSCHNVYCQPLNYSILTDKGALQIERKNAIDNISSVVQSRSWLTGMRPLLDLFNHHEMAESITREKNTKEYRLYTPFKIKKGEQAYNNYGKFDTFGLYRIYGYIAEQEPTCADMLMMRVGKPRARVSCVRRSNSTVEDMFFEMLEAYKENDFIMMKAAAQWINANINYD